MASLALFTLTFSCVAVADETDPGDQAGTPAVSVLVDLGAFAKTEVGKMLIETGVKAAANEMKKDPSEAMEAVIKSLGFDPIKQNAKIAAKISNLENPLDGLQVSMQLKDTTGNLEGFLLAAPEYSSTKYGSHEVHSANFDGQPVYAAFHTGAAGTKRIMAATSEGAVTDMLDSFADGESGFVVSSLQIPQGQFAGVRLLTPPEELLADTPLAHVGELMGEVSVTLSKDRDDLVLQVMLKTKAEDRAEQVKQLAQGVVAMAALFEEPIREEMGAEVADRVLPRLNSVVVEREGTVITIGLRIPEDLVVKFAAENIDIEL